VVVLGWSGRGRAALQSSDQTARRAGNGGLGVGVAGGLIRNLWEGGSMGALIRCGRLIQIPTARQVVAGEEEAASVKAAAAKKIKVGGIGSGVLLSSLIAIIIVNHSTVCSVPICSVPSSTAKSSVGVAAIDGHRSSSALPAPSRLCRTAC